MLIAADDDAFAALIAGRPAGEVEVAPELETPEILAMRAGLARRIRAGFTPSTWLIVEQATVVGLVSLVIAPAGGVITIGYGVARSCRGAGIMQRAIADLLALAAADDRVIAIAAETSTANPASQRVLTANGFHRTGTRVDADDGELIGWRFDVPDNGTLPLAAGRDPA